MFYIVCKSCGELLGNRYLLYDRITKKIEHNDKLTIEQKKIKMMEAFDDIKLPKNKYCCRALILTKVSYAELLR